MEESVDLKKETLANQIQTELIGEEIEKSVIIKINSENLVTNGEICFPANLLAWKNLIKESNTENCSNIFEYYLRRQKCNTVELSKQDILKKASDSLVIASKKWPIKLEKASLYKDKLCLFVERKSIIESAIKNALRFGPDYGRRKPVGKSVCLKVTEDQDSDLTTARLRIIKEVSERLFSLIGYKVVDTTADFNYLLTTKRQKLSEDNYQCFICGVVKNQHNNSKEKSLTWSRYMDEKMKELTRVAEDKYSLRNEESYLKNIARAIVTFELLLVKPSRPVFVQINQVPDKRVSASKGGSFVLYNSARISAILQKFKEEVCLGHYPSLPDINDADFGQLNQEEEWELAYNFILEYPEMIEHCIRNDTSLEMSLQTICLFLSRLSQKYSAYYRRTRILTEGRDHLVPAMMARLYLLRALQIVVHNSLNLLNITPVNHM